MQLLEVGNLRDNATLIILPLFIITVSIALNFSEFLMGSPASIKNLIVTMVYLVTWIIVIKISSTTKKKGILKYYSIFWIITLFFAVVTGYVNVTETNADWAISFVILFLTQWYGIHFFVESYLTASILIAFISLLMFITTFLSFKKAK